MSESSTLMPCPFCGSIPSTFGTDSAGKWGWVECCIRGPEVRAGYRPLAEWKDKAIAEWNTRKASAEVAAAKGLPVGWIGHQLRRAFQLGASHHAAQSEVPAVKAATEHANAVLRELSEPGERLEGSRRVKAS